MGDFQVVEDLSVQPPSTLQGLQEWLVRHPPAPTGPRSRLRHTPTRRWCMDRSEPSARSRVGGQARMDA